MGEGVMGEREAESLVVWCGKTGTGARDRNLSGALFGLGGLEVRSKMRRTPGTGLLLEEEWECE